MKQIDRLLFLQGGKCFFCTKPIPVGEESVEHLVASASGGTNEDDNCVVCCKSVNLAFGSLPVKRKMEAIIKHGEAFECPRPMSALNPITVDPTHQPDSESERLDRLVAHLIKMGASRPRKVSTLASTINAVFKKGLSEEQLEFLLDKLKAREWISVVGTKVSYSLPSLKPV